MNTTQPTCPGCGQAIVGDLEACGDLEDGICIYVQLAGGEITPQEYEAIESEQHDDKVVDACRKVWGL